MVMERSRRGTVLGLAALCAAATLPIATGRTLAAGPDLRLATALIMIEDRGCRYCVRFDAEARPSYENSPEGRFAPLVRRPRSAPDVRFLSEVVYSPTFILLVEGREIGRVVGYQGADLFWMEMAGLMRKAGFRPGAAE